MKSKIFHGSFGFEIDGDDDDDDDVVAGVATAAAAAADDDDDGGSDDEDDDDNDSSCALVVIDSHGDNSLKSLSWSGKIIDRIKYRNRQLKVSILMYSHSR